MVAFIVQLIILCVVLGIVYIIAKAILDYLGVPWGALALKVIGLLCLLAVAVYILSAFTNGAPALLQLNPPRVR
jgi:hypothetical protein